MRKALKLSITFTLLLFVSSFQTAFAATSTSNVGDFSTITTETVSAKKSKKSLRKQFRKVIKSVKQKVKSVKESLKENASSGQLLVLGLVGLALIGLGAILGIGFLSYVGGIVILIAAVWLVLKLVGIA